VSDRPPPDSVPDGAAELIEKSELIEVRVVQVRAELAEPGRRHNPEVANVTFEIGAAYGSEIGVFGNKFDYKIGLMDSSDEPIGTIEFSIVVDYEIEEAFTPDDDAAAFVSKTTGYFAAYPYARELVFSLSSRLGLDPLTIGMLTRGALEPKSVASRGTSLRNRIREEPAES
jgi:hypothetical protein